MTWITNENKRKIDNEGMVKTYTTIKGPKYGWVCICYVRNAVESTVLNAHSQFIQAMQFFTVMKGPRYGFFRSVSRGITLAATDFWLWPARALQNVMCNESIWYLNFTLYLILIVLN
jgi:hypothetical protein